MGGPGSGPRPHSGKAAYNQWRGNKDLVTVSIDGKKGTYSKKGAARSRLHKRGLKTAGEKQLKTLNKMRALHMGKGLNKGKSNKGK
jgi:hypothetical protein